MLKKIFFLYVTLISLPATLSALDTNLPTIDPDSASQEIEQINDLKRELEERMLNNNISIEEQKQKIREIYKKLIKKDAYHYSLLENTLPERFSSWNRGIAVVRPEILEFLVDELGHPAKNALINILQLLPDLDLTAKTIKNLQILKERSIVKLTELEKKKITKLLHHNKLNKCKKTLSWTKEKRKDAKYEEECIKSKKLEKVFKF